MNTTGLLPDLREAQRCHCHFEVMDAALACTPDEGLVLEFGVFQTTSINHTAGRLPGRLVHSFASFEGLPDFWRPDFEPGMFSTDGRLPPVRANVRLIKGWFDASLPAFCRAGRAPIALLHVDCDLYSSTRCVFDQLGNRLIQGSIIVFDELFNYPGREDHEFRAFTAFAAARTLSYEYLAFNAEHEQVAIRVTG
ncbi:TylF/MycF/NovP-related O-methyltransferase [Muricoccus radiodurans]|uniref:TylF/MycF/NovP-related O-methyltransferase n=1 Tax=Muricoccus radiodurans TaxID=2231721 RepID=UPI003CF1F775